MISELYFWGGTMPLSITMFVIIHPVARVLISIDRIHSMVQSTFLRLSGPTFYKWFCSLWSFQERHTAHTKIITIRF